MAGDAAAVTYGLLSQNRFFLAGFPPIVWSVLTIDRRYSDPYDEDSRILPNQYEGLNWRRKCVL